MNLVTLAGELAAAAQTITGLRVHQVPGLAIRAPALVIGYPEQIDYDGTYQRGADALRVPLFLLIGPTSQRAGGLDLLSYLSGSGARSVKAAIEAGTYTAADVVHVASANPGAITSEGVEYLGATFETMITGRGTG